MKLKVVIIIVCVLTLYSQTLFAGSKSIFGTKHNLSVSGQGDIKSSVETRVCIFCHTTHNASSEGPLWNHKTTTTGKFQTYNRSTMVSQPEQPNGSTKLCLSCHDGTIAVGAIRSLPSSIPMKNVNASGKIPSSRKSHIGTDLRGTHPISVKYDQQTAFSTKHLKWPPFDAEKSVGADANGYVQCTSCHDPHDNSKSNKYPFWKKTTFSDVCKVCHKF